jgi:hypothetical protein
MDPNVATLGCESCAPGSSKLALTTPGQHQCLTNGNFRQAQGLNTKNKIVKIISKMILSKARTLSPSATTKELRRIHMPLWQRLVLTLVAIVVAGIVAGLIRFQLFGFGLPCYLGGVIGGLTAVPVWGF